MSAEQAPTPDAEEVSDARGRLSENPGQPPAGAPAATRLDAQGAIQAYERVSSAGVEHMVAEWT